MQKRARKFWAVLPQYLIRLTNGEAYRVPGKSKEDAIERVLLNPGVTREHVQSCIVDY